MFFRRGRQSTRSRNGNARRSWRLLMMTGRRFLKHQETRLRAAGKNERKRRMGFLPEQPYGWFTPEPAKDGLKWQQKRRRMGVNCKRDAKKIRIADLRISLTPSVPALPVTGRLREERQFRLCLHWPAQGGTSVPALPTLVGSGRNGGRRSRFRRGRRQQGRQLRLPAVALRLELH